MFTVNTAWASHETHNRLQLYLTNAGEVGLTQCVVVIS